MDTDAARIKHIMIKNHIADAPSPPLCLPPRHPPPPIHSSSSRHCQTLPNFHLPPAAFIKQKNKKGELNDKG
jgi:hypothetical protein